MKAFFIATSHVIRNIRNFDDFKRAEICFLSYFQTSYFADIANCSVIGKSARNLPNATSIRRKHRCFPKRACAL
jgi:hypothetical protein